MNLFFLKSTHSWPRSRNRCSVRGCKCTFRCFQSAANTLFGVQNLKFCSGISNLLRFSRYGFIWDWGATTDCSRRSISWSTYWINEEVEVYKNEVTSQRYYNVRFSRSLWFFAFSRFWWRCADWIQTHTLWIVQCLMPLLGTYSSEEYHADQRWTCLCTPTWSYA